MNPHPNNQYFTQLRHPIFSDYPTTIRRSVYLSHGVVIDHSVNRWLYQRWIANAMIEKELWALHKEMAKTLIHFINHHRLTITFVHIDPLISKYPEQDHSSCQCWPLFQ